MEKFRNYPNGKKRVSTTTVGHASSFRTIQQTLILRRTIRQQIKLKDKLNSMSLNN